jgi:hypothetical protein
MIWGVALADCSLTPYYSSMILPLGCASALNVEIVRADFNGALEERIVKVFTHPGRFLFVVVFDDLIWVQN